MVLDQEIPSFRELTGKKPEAAGQVSSQPASEAHSAFRRQSQRNRREWLEKIKVRCRTLTAAYMCGELKVNYDLSLVYDEAVARFAAEHGFDYLGVCLLFNPPLVSAAQTPDFVPEVKLQSEIHHILRVMARVEQNQRKAS